MKVTLTIESDSLIYWRNVIDTINREFMYIYKENALKSGMSFNLLGIAGYPIGKVEVE